MINYTVRRLHTSVVNNDELYVMGGTDGTDKFNDIWMINLIQSSGYDHNSNIMNAISMTMIVHIGLGGFVLANYLK